MSNTRWSAIASAAVCSAVIAGGGVYFLAERDPVAELGRVTQLGQRNEIVTVGNGVQIIRQDAAQRGTLVISRDASGKPISAACAEPPPDVSSNVVASLTSSLSVLARGAAQQEASAARAIAADVRTATETIFQRSQGIQLLRDTMFRLCEAYLNGIIDVTAFSQTLTRLIATANFIIPFEQCVSIGRALAQLLNTPAVDRPTYLSDCFNRATTLVEAEVASNSRRLIELEEQIQNRIRETATVMERIQQLRRDDSITVEILDRISSRGQDPESAADIGIIRDHMVRRHRDLPN